MKRMYRDVSAEKFLLKFLRVISSKHDWSTWLAVDLIDALDKELDKP